MRIFVWALRLLVFLIFLALAVRNLQPATLSFFAEYTWQAPLVVMLLAAFLLGVVLCALSLSLVVLRQRRDVLRLSAELHEAKSAKTVEPSVVSPYQPEVNAANSSNSSNALMPPVA